MRSGSRITTVVKDERISSCPSSVLSLSHQLITYAHRSVRSGEQKVSTYARPISRPGQVHLTSGQGVTAFSAGRHRPDRQRIDGVQVR